MIFLVMILIIILYFVNSSNVFTHYAYYIEITVIFKNSFINTHMMYAIQFI